MQPKKDKNSESLPLLPLSLQRQKKPMTLREKEKKLESCLKKLKSKQWRNRTKEASENSKPNQETIVDSAKKPEEKVKEKRKPGRPGKKKLTISNMP